MYNAPAGAHCRADVASKDTRLTILRQANETKAPSREVPQPCLRSTCALAVMAKASIPGETKTRLVPPLTRGEAAALNTVFLRDAADNMLSTGARADVNGWMAHAPAGAEAFFKDHLPLSIGLLETVGPTLGDCLQ
jgi:hypothetical protein